MDIRLFCPTSKVISCVFYNIDSDRHEQLFYDSGVARLFGTQGV
jgi:hypothetical protein